jgi:hypothetical protein
MPITAKGTQVGASSTGSSTLSHSQGARYRCTPACSVFRKAGATK